MNNLPILFNCFADGYGGFECYINQQFQVVYRILPKNYNSPTADSNGVKLFDVVLDQWNTLVIEHEKPYLARAQLIAYMNEKQAASYPIDYPRFDQNAKLTNMNICKGLTSQLGYFVFFRTHFSHLKKFVQQLIKIESLDEFILTNES